MSTIRRIILEGDVPSPINPPSGCIFSTLCPKTLDRCKTEEPKLRDWGAGHGKGHEAACFLYE